MSVRGYPSQTKLARGKADFATVEPVRAQQNGLSVNAHLYVYVVGTDTSEALSSDSVIVATAHAARIGDVIRFTSGTFNNTEVKVSDVATNSITLAEDMPSAIGAGVTFQILRPKYPVVGSDGSISVTTTPGPLLFTLDGADQEVTEDTVTPANNRPLPVKLMGVTGPITLTADQINVHNSASGANPDSIRIGDGTDELAVNADGSINVSGVATEVTLSALNAKFNSLGQKAMAASAPVVIASDQSAIPVTGTISTSEEAVVADGGALPAVVKVVAGYDGANVQVLHTDVAGDLQVDVLSSALPTGAATEVTLATRASEATLSALNAKVTAVNTGAVTISAALPAGNNNIGDVDVLTLPAILAATNSIRIGDGTDLANVTALGQLEVAITAPLPAGTNLIGSVSLAALDVVDFLDTPLLIASSTNIPASGSSPLTVVASLAADVKKLQILDTTGEYIGIYADPAGTPILLAISGPGSDQTIECTIPAATVIGVRNMKNAAISVGEYCINFIG